MEVLLVSLGVLAGALLLYFGRRIFTRSPISNDTTTLFVQQQIESLRVDVRSNLQHITESVNQQLALVTQQLQAQTQSVGSRLDSATRVIGDVQKNLGELGQATLEIKELGQSVSKLEELLQAPKLRGGLGEYLLEDLLKQVLPAGHFAIQHRFRSGQIVDAVIHTSDRLAPIDAKFPLENFRKMIAATSDGERKSCQKSFVADVKKHIDAIADKYICPDEGTFPFALMYIPAENIYYEVIVKDDGAASGSDLYAYAIDRKVIPVSPNSFYAYLQVIALGLRGLHIEERAHEILDVLGRLQGDVAQVRDAFETLGTHLDNARKKFDETDKRLTSFEGRLNQVSEQPIDAGRAPHLIDTDGFLREAAAPHNRT